MQGDISAIATLETMMAQASKTLVAADLDGTLAEFEEDPSAVRVYPSTTRAGGRLAKGYRTAVLTGRGDEFATKHAPWTHIVASNYGAAVRTRRAGPDAVWRHERFFDKAARVAALVGEYEERIAAAGLIVQEQGATRMLHWRTLGEADRSNALGLIGVLEQAAYGRGLVPHRFEHALDIRPGDISKATGLRRVLMAAGTRLDGNGPPPVDDEPGPEYVIVVGDDVKSDRDAFVEADALVAQGKLRACLKVAAVHPDRPENRPFWALADIRVPGVAGVTAFLDGLAGGADWFDDARLAGRQS